MLRILGAAGLFAAICSAPAWADDDNDAKRKFDGLKKDPEIVFKKLDADGDGKLTKDELKKLIERLPKLKEKGDQIVERMFNSADTNGDGKLSLEEFKKLMEMGEKLKGKIDPAKLKGAREKLKNKKGDEEKP